MWVFFSWSGVERSNSDHVLVEDISVNLDVLNEWYGSNLRDVKRGIQPFAECREIRKSGTQANDLEA